MSWWWVAPLVVASVGAGLLTFLARRVTVEAGKTVTATADLQGTLNALRAARPGLVVDLTAYRPAANLVPERSE